MVCQVGLGIHGEAGAIVCALQPADAVVDMLLQYITSQDAGRGYMRLKAGEPVALLINNLGGSTALELAIAARRAIATLEGPDYGVMVTRCYTGAFMTALDMVGLSISVIRLTQPMLARLDAPSAAPAWPGMGEINRSRTITAPTLPSGAGGSLESLLVPSDAVRLAPVQASAIGNAIHSAANALIAAEQQLTTMDEICGDGDCGTTLSCGAAAILEDIGKYALDHPPTTALGLAWSLGRSMGGSSGALYSIFMNSIASSLSGQQISTSTVAAAFAAGCAAMSGYGGAAKGQRTMLDALIPAADAMNSAAREDLSISVALQRAASAAELGADSTKTMIAAAGRASYLPTNVIENTPDPGAQAVAIWLRAVASCCA